jgi:hypothetical protein
MTPGILLGWLGMSQGFYRRRNRHRAFAPLRKSPPSGDYPQITQIFADPEIRYCVLFLAPYDKLSLTHVAPHSPRSCRPESYPAWG